MSLPSDWVDSLFARLAVRYGAAFMRQWPDTDPALVKADWAEVLDGFSGGSIRYGLDNLPADRPPNAMQFRAICNGGPRSDPPAIANGVMADPAKVVVLVSSICRAPDTIDYKAWTRRLQKIEETRGGILPNETRMTRTQREMWRTALKEPA